MRRRVLFIVIFLLLTMLLPAQRRDIHILAVNDMHASLGAMPQLAAIADSLRTLYPSLLVFSAGDNRTGNPYNDLYKPSGYPMVALMNQIGFSASALGNHEFDGHSLAPLCPLSAFPYLCANITADDSTGVHTHPYKLFDVDGLKVAVIGIVQVSRQGTPNTHPDGIRGLHFESPHEVIRRYEWLSQQCDATILLSHNGYENDVRASKDYPWIDLIIGGHSHRQLSDTIIGPFSYSSSLPVLITQNRNQLSNVTHITLTVDGQKPFDRKKTYRVVTNSYVIAKGGKYAPTATRELPETTSDMLTSYLEQQHTVSYQGKGSLHYIHTQ